MKDEQNKEPRKSIAVSLPVTVINDLDQAGLDRRAAGMGWDVSRANVIETMLAVPIQVHKTLKDINASQLDVHTFMSVAIARFMQDITEYASDKNISMSEAIKAHVLGC